MTTPRSSSPLSSDRRFAMVVVASVVCLTLLFTVQDAMRRRVAGANVEWAHTLAINALDWITWGLLLPFVVAAGQRIRLDGGGRRAASVLGWLTLAVAFCAVQSTITGLVIRLTSPELFGLVRPSGGLRPPLGQFLLGWGLATASLNLLIFGMTAGAFHALLYYRDLRTRQLRERDLEARLARAELNVLRMQLQPHFLFNALHTVSSLMVSDVPTAQRIVSALGDLLRSSLDHTARQEITVRDELVFVQRYLDIQRARFRHRLMIDLNVPGEVEDALVPSLILQPLVENAIRHGIEPSATGGQVWIHAERRGEALVLTVENQCMPGVASDSARRAGGVGLANVEARLAQLYGASHAFRAAPNQDGRFVARLSLPFHTEGSR